MRTEASIARTACSCPRTPGARRHAVTTVPFGSDFDIVSSALVSRHDPGLVILSGAARVRKPGGFENDHVTSTVPAGRRRSGSEHLIESPSRTQGGRRPTL